MNGLITAKCTGCATATKSKPTKLLKLVLTSCRYPARLFTNVFSRDAASAVRRNHCHLVQYVNTEAISFSLNNLDHTRGIDTHFTLPNPTSPDKTTFNNSRVTQVIALFRIRRPITRKISGSEMIRTQDNIKNKKATDSSDSAEQRVNRRKFIGTVGIGSAGMAAPIAGFAGDTSFKDKKSASAISSKRAQQAYHKRHDAALAYLRQNPAKLITNRDDERYADYRGSFFKTLPQNEFGEVDVDAYRAMKKALLSNDVEGLEAVGQSSWSVRGLANPLAGWAYEMIGPDSWSLRMPPAPAFASEKSAAEMCEVYWQALTRDVPFQAYDSDALINRAASDLNNYAEALGVPYAVTPQTLFRGHSGGDLTGPYISQFLTQPTYWGIAELTQQFRLPVAHQDFCQDHYAWLQVQRGAAPGVSTILESSPRYIANGRDLAEYVHKDALYQAYLTAALIMLSMGDDALDPNLPYFQSNNQVGFVTFGGASILDIVAKVARVALKAAWFQKWLVHRRLRPEMFAARAEFQYQGSRNYGIDNGLFNSDAVSELLSKNGNLHLPLAYPEGSPTHPSYPAGHATVAGACATVLKAVFNEDYEYPAPHEVSSDGYSAAPYAGVLTLGSEINKLASNITLGRDTAGVHYRSDGIDGMNLGEQVALGILADYSETYAEEFDGFNLTTFSGEQITVGNGSAKPSRKRHHRSRRRRFHREEF